jgi:Flp pilus assembly protein TadG
LSRPCSVPILPRLARDRRGASAVEFGLIAPLLLLLAAGAVDGSRFVVQALQVRAAAQAGADFALKNGWDANGIQTAVTSSTTLSTLTAAAPVEIKACVLNGAVTQIGCPASAATGEFVVVAAQNAFRPLLPWPGLAHASTISARAEARIQ